MLASAIEQFLDHRRAKNCAVGTLELYRWALDGWLAWRSRSGRSPLLADVGLEDFRGFLGHVASLELSGETVASYRRILRALWRFLAAEGLLSTAQARFWENGRVPAPIVPTPAPRPYCDPATLDALLAGCGEPDTERNARNQAILLMLYESGMRAAELCSLTDGAVNFRLRRACVVGKGGKRAFVFWYARAGAALARYLHLRSGRSGGALPLFRGCSSRNPGGPLTPNLIRAMVKRLGVELPPGSPVHFLRHGFAHAAISAGLDISQVQQLMRHSSTETTMRYLRERPDRLQELHRRIFERKDGGR